MKKRVARQNRRPCLVADGRTATCPRPTRPGWYPSARPTAGTVRRRLRRKAGRGRRRRGWWWRYPRITIGLRRMSRRRTPPRWRRRGATSAEGRASASRRVTSAPRQVPTLVVWARRRERGSGGLQAAAAAVSAGDAPSFDPSVHVEIRRDPSVPSFGPSILSPFVRSVHSSITLPPLSNYSPALTRRQPRVEKRRLSPRKDVRPHRAPRVRKTVSRARALSFSIRSSANERTTCGRDRVWM